jgi:hypothetical protein
VKAASLHERAFSLLEVLIIIAIIAALSGIGIRLLGQGPIFKASIKTFRAYLQGVSDYAAAHGNCYLLVGNSSAEDGPLCECMLLACGTSIGPVFPREYFFRLGPGEFFVSPGSATPSSAFPVIRIQMPEEIPGHWIPIALGKQTGPIQFVLAFQSARQISHAILRIQENGTVTLE